MKLTNRNRGILRPIFLSTLALLTLGMMAQAQVFTSNPNDLTLGFRKNSPYTETPAYEVVVDIGQASSYTTLTVGTTISVPGYSASQLTGSYQSLNDLSWSVFGGFNAGSGYPGYVRNTLWLTVPRTNNAVRSSDATRLIYTQQQSTKSEMSNIPSGAGQISQALGAGTFVTSSFVREPTSYASQILSASMGGIVDSTQGTLKDTWPASEPNTGNLEGLTPDDFSSGTVRSDLYEVWPMTDGTGATVVDPHTGTSGLAWHVGYFEFHTDGTMTFTRAAANTAPPTQVTLHITRTNTTSTISFGSSSGVTYTLYYTNSAGLRAPVSTWPSQVGTISGDGTTRSFQDTTTDPTRFYRVLEQ